MVAALAAARRIGCKTIALTGSGGGRCAELADVLLDVPGRVPPRVQEVHQIIYHVFCELVEEALAKKAGELGLAVILFQLAIMSSAVGALTRKKILWLVGLALGVWGLGYVVKNLVF